jgi:hypothetical protein
MRRARLAGVAWPHRRSNHAGIAHWTAGSGRGAPWVHTYDMIPLSVAVVVLAAAASRDARLLLAFAWFWPGALTMVPIPIVNRGKHSGRRMAGMETCRNVGMAYEVFG